MINVYNKIKKNIKGRKILYRYRCFICSLTKIKNSFTKCLESIKCIEEQTSGTYKITYFEDKLKKCMI